MSNEILSQVKIGARILDEESIKVLLPNVDSIYTNIEKMREVAKHNNSRNNKERSREYNRYYNNVISVLGGRGSGKTSALLTVKDKLDFSTEYENDIKMPIIVPEKMGNTSDVLGWTIGLFENIIKDINEDIDNKKDKFKNDSNYFKGCRKLDANILDIKFNELLEYYTYSNESYRNILLNNYDGFRDYIKKSRNLLAPEQELACKFNELVDEIIKAKKNLEDKEPLIFMYFDDVDLSPERCMEVLNVILRYLSHSNIVTFIAGDYNIFSEVITISNLTKENLLNGPKDMYFYMDEDNGGMTALESKKLLTQDLLKKVMPPAMRFYIPKLSNYNKSQFKFSEIHKDADSDENKKFETLEELILSKLVEKRNMNIKKSDIICKNKNEIMEIYFEIFDNNPRGIMNVYYFLHSLKNECNNKEFVLNLKSFLNIIINSSYEFIKYEEEIYKIIDIKDNLEDSFINYKYLEQLSHPKRRINEDRTITITKNNPDEILKLFLLASFIENIISFRKCERKTHGSDSLANILNKGYSNFKPYPNTKNMQLLLMMHTEILNGISKNGISDIDNLVLDSHTLLIYFEILENMSDKGISQLLIERYKEDEVWVSTIVDTILRISCTDEMTINKYVNKAINELSKILPVNNNESKSVISKIKTNYDGIDNFEQLIKNTKSVVNDLSEYLNENNIMNELLENLDDTYDSNNSMMTVLNRVKEMNDNNKVFSKSNIEIEEKKYIINQELHELLSNDKFLLEEIIGNISDIEQIQSIIKSESIEGSISEEEYNTLLKILKLNRKDALRTSGSNMRRQNLTNIIRSIEKSEVQYIISEDKKVDLVEDITNIFKLDININSILEILNKRQKENESGSMLYKFEQIKKEITSETIDIWFQTFVKSRQKRVEKENRDV